ncbi:MAG: hypothetical protein WCF36_09045 [Candidatus Nanopelagicales bacterium]
MQKAVTIHDYARDRYRDSFVAAREMGRRSGKMPDSRDEALRWASADPEVAHLLRRRY